MDCASRLSRRTAPGFARAGPARAERQPSDRRPNVIGPRVSEKSASTRGPPVGMLHVFDGRLLPMRGAMRSNRRRTSTTSTTSSAPYAAAIARRCRQQSKSRNDGRRSHSLSTTFDALEAPSAATRHRLRPQLGKWSGPRRANISRGSWRNGIRHRASSHAARRRSRDVESSKRLSLREQGRVDALRWLYDNGDVPLFAAAVAALRQER